MPLVFTDHSKPPELERELRALSDGIDRLAGGNIPGAIRVVTIGGGTTSVRQTSNPFITDAGNSGSGTVNKTYGTGASSEILASFESNDDSHTIEATIYVEGADWLPVEATLERDGVFVEAIAASGWTQTADHRRFTATFTVTDASANAINPGYVVKTHDGGESPAVRYTRTLNAPEILTIVLENQGSNPDPYPGVQTQFAAGQTISISGTVEAHADEVYVTDFQTTNGRGLQGPFAVTAGVFGPFNVNAGDGNLSAQRVRMYAKVTGESPGGFSIDVSYPVELDQTVPTFSGVTHSYPAGPPQQEALKDTETDDVTITHTNIEAGDTYVYDDNGTGELTIPAATTYAGTKGVQRLSGSYREIGVNYRVTVTRTAKNGLAAMASTTVKIAHVSPVIEIGRNSGGAALLRMGTDDGTNNYRETTVYIVSSQSNLSTHSPTLAPDGGDTSAFTGTWTASGFNNYFRPFRVEDGDLNSGGQAANNFTWGACSVRNRAGKEATVVTYNQTYAIGGFEVRTLTIPAHPAHEVTIGGPIAVDTGKLVAVATGKGGSPTQAFEGSIVEHNDPNPDNNNFFTISDGADGYDADGANYHLSDNLLSQANSSGTLTVTLKEDP